MKQYWLIFLLLSSACFAADVGSCPKNVQRLALNLTASGDNTIVASDPILRIYVWQFFLVNSHATTDENITLKEGATSISGAYLLKAAGGSHTAPCTGVPWANVPAGSAFILNLSATGSLQGTVYYTQERP